MTPIISTVATIERIAKTLLDSNEVALLNLSLKPV